MANNDPKVTPLPGQFTCTDEEAEKLISDAIKELDKIDEERSLLNERAGEIRAGLRAKNITVEAVNATRQYTKKKEEKRAGFDKSYVIARKAAGAPIQLGLFGKAEESRKAA